jgi:hypothetical protein
MLAACWLYNSTKRVVLGTLSTEQGSQVYVDDHKHEHKEVKRNSSSSGSGGGSGGWYYSASSSGTSGIATKVRLCRLPTTFWILIVMAHY